MKKLLGLLVFLLLALPAFAQDGFLFKDIALVNAGGQVQVLGNATITVCQAGASGIPCSPLQNIYTDVGLTQQITGSVVKSDANGNFSFYIAPGNNYIYTVVSSNGSLSASYTFSAPCVVSGSGCNGGGGSTTPGGANGQAQINNSGSFGGSNVVIHNGNLAPQGPIPYRDVTALMPVGGCDESGVTGSREVGTISLSTPTTLSLTYNNHFINNGCGVFVAGAGPTSSISTPSKGAAPSPVVVGPTGSTTINYQIAAIDCSFGTSAASASIQVTTAPATRTSTNYVAIFWTSVANACGYLMYTDQGTGTFVPLGYSFDCSVWTAGGVCGGLDKGQETNTWTGFNGFWPTTPPAAATPQALITTFTAGAGTNTLTLATGATTAVTSVFVMPDISPFLKTALASAATDGTPSTLTKGTVLIPSGLYYASTLPYPNSGITGIKVNLAGTLTLFGLPIEGNLGATGSTDYVSIQGTGGTYTHQHFSLPGSVLSAWTTLGALVVVAQNGFTAEGITFAAQQAGIIQNSAGGISLWKDAFTNAGSGPMWQIDANAFFSFAKDIDFNANPANNNVPAVWFLGLTSSAHSSVYQFNNISWDSHTVRVDYPFSPAGSFGDWVFDGQQDIEDNQDPCFICMATAVAPGNVDFNAVDTGDVMASFQSFFYNYNGAVNPGAEINIHGQTTGWGSLVGSAATATIPTFCRDWTYENPNQGGASLNSVGYVGNIFGQYSGCDFGMTMTGIDTQSEEFIATGGNDPTFGPAGEFVIAHAFRRPFTTLTDGGAGSLGAATYYIQVAMKDASGRLTAPSPEQSLAISASHQINVSSATQIFFPSGCRVYFGTSAGGENNYFDSTTVTNGTCTFTLTTTAGETAGTPSPVGNAMKSWLSAENNANSCLFCGLSGGLGTGFLGFNLNAAQYAAPPAGVQFPFNGGVHSYQFYSASETTAPTGVASVDQLYADSSAHRWKKIENNGAPQIVGSADSTACAYQGPAAAITGTGAAATYYTCTLPAGVMGAGQGLIITAISKHTTGTASVSYTLQFGGTSTTAVGPAGSANQIEKLTFIVMNNPGSTSAQTISTVGQDSNQGTNSIKLDTAAINTASPVTINIQFNVANTDAITPEMFLVELKQ